jgi:hypothetical protein
MQKFTIARYPRGTNGLALSSPGPVQNICKLSFLKCLFLGFAIALAAEQVQGQACTPVTISYQGGNYTASTSNITCGTKPYDTQYDAYVAAHPNLVKADVNNGNYNCHAFAWANRTDIWINTTQPGTNIAPQIYYNSQSSNYYTTSTINDAEIAVYGDATNNPVHSAIHLTNTSNSSNGFAVKYLKLFPQYAGWWISKWDGGPLIIHQQLSDYPPYFPGETITYYKKRLDAGTNSIQYKASDFSILGPKAVCTAGAQFKLSNTTTGTDIINSFPAGFSVTWSGSSHISFSPSTTAYPVNVSSNTNGSGEWVKAHITFPDGTSGDVTQYPVWSGVPAYISSISTSQFSPGGAGYISIPVNQYNTELYAWPFNQGDVIPPNGVIDSHGASSYNWTCQYDTYTQNPVVIGYRYTQGGFSNTGAAILTIHASNACGSTTQFQSLSVTSNGSMYSLSPNPASSQVKVTVSGNNSSSSQAISAAPAPAVPSGAPATYTIRILDLFGMQYYNSKQTGNSFTIPVSNLKNGNYVVEISDGKTVTSKPLLIAH